MIKIFFTMASIASWAFVPEPGFGQQAQPAAVVGLKAPREEHLKIEEGVIWIKKPGENWVNTHDAPTVGNASKALRLLYPDDMFAVDPLVAEVPISDLIIRANDARTDLEALRTACSGKFTFGEGPNSLYTLNADSRAMADLSKSEDHSIQCFNLSGYLERTAKLHPLKDQDQARAQTQETVADLKQIIASTINDFDSTIVAPRFQFYAQAQLLIVTGSHRAIDVAAKVIRALPGQQNFWSYGRDVDNSSGSGFFYETQNENPAYPATTKDDAFAKPPQPAAGTQGPAKP
jgi:hypothetical protein